MIVHEVETKIWVSSTLDLLIAHQGYLNSKRRIRKLYIWVAKIIDPSPHFKKIEPNWCTSKGGVTDYKGAVYVE